MYEFRFKEDSFDDESMYEHSDINMHEFTKTSKDIEFMESVRKFLNKIK